MSTSILRIVCGIKSCGNCVSGDEDWGEDEYNAWHGYFCGSDDEIT